MLTALLVLCAVAADAAPLAANSATAAQSDLSPPSAVPPALFAAPLEVKVTKLKKFHALQKVLKAGKKPHVALEKVEVPTEQPAAPVVEVTAAPVTPVEESPQLPEREVELLKAHIEAPLVAAAMFEDEKAARFRHSALFGFPSFF